MKNILIIGAGAMGSAFSVPCVENNNNVSLIGTHLEDSLIETIKSKNNFSIFGSWYSFPDINTIYSTSRNKYTS